MLNTIYPKKRIAKKMTLSLYFSQAPPASTVTRADWGIMGELHHAAMNHGLFSAARRRYRL
jgi:hypothetical protein